MLSIYSFWIGLAVVFYTYLGYAIVVVIIAALKGRQSIPRDLNDDELPEVTLVIAAYNEEDIIREKILNTLELDYPENKLNIYFVTDGSSDQSPDIIRNHSRFRLFHEPQRKGKIHAVNRVMKEVKAPLTVFCDANTLLNAQAIRCIVRHYADPTVGGVAGEKRIFSQTNDNASGSGEGFYWKYESFLKRKEAEVYSVVGAAGELFSIRTALFDPPPQDMIIEDFYLSMQIVAKGYRFAYEPGAFATETASISVAEEWKRKVRICAGAFQAMSRLTHLLNPMKHGVVSFQYFSHRVLRWTLAPLSLPIIFVANALLASDGHSFYVLFFALQVLFYLVALFGYTLRDRKVAIKGLFIPYYFAVMNAAVLAGLIRYTQRKQKVTWERARRAELNAK